ncbi:MAG: LysR substrate-binding domain-containing protein [Oscillospiraceae bacterium]
MKTVNFEYYKVFYYVAKFKNITAAAKALYLSQPSVSRCISNLEDELGCRLFSRSKHGVSLTAEGSILFKHVNIACKHLFSAEEELKLYQNNNYEMLRIGISDVALQPKILRFMSECHDYFSYTKLKIYNMSTPQAADALRANFIDLAISSSPILNKKDLSITIIDDLQDIVIAGSRYSDLKDKTLSLNEISDYPLILLQEGTTTRSYIDQIFRTYDLTINPGIELATVNQIIPLVENNFGIGFSQESIAKEAIEQGRIFKINVKEPIPPRHICVMACTNYPISDNAMRFMEQISQKFKNAVSV